MLKLLKFVCIDPVAVVVVRKSAFHDVVAVTVTQIPDFNR